MNRSTLFLMVYDISDDHRRTKLHSLLRQYGIPVQKSAFEARLTSTERARLLERAAAFIDPRCDRFALYTIPRGHEEHIVVLGLPRLEIPDPKFYIV